MVQPMGIMQTSRGLLVCPRPRSVGKNAQWRAMEVGSLDLGENCKFPTAHDTCYAGYASLCLSCSLSRSSGLVVIGAGFPLRPDDLRFD